MRANQSLRTVLPAILVMAVSACTSENTSAPITAPLPPPVVAEVPVSPMPWDGHGIEGEGFNHCALDAINGVTAAGGQFVAMGDAPITVEGWIVGPDPVDPGTFTLTFSGPRNIKADIPTGVLREDVSAALANNALARTGFKASLPPSSLAAGDYELQLRVAAEGLERACANRYSLRIK